MPNNRGIKQAIVPGSNEYVKEQHVAARDAYWLWREMGKPGNWDVFTLILSKQLLDGVHLTIQDGGPKSYPF